MPRFLFGVVMNKEQAFTKWYGGIPDSGNIETYETFCEGWNAAIKSTKQEEVVPYQEILDIMNKIFGKEFKATAMHKMHIRARWNEGYRLPEFKKVCEIKFAQWDSDPKMRLYLRPETIWGTKMDSYLNEEIKSKRTIEPEWL